MSAPPLTVPGGWWEPAAASTDALRATLTTLGFVAAALGALLCVAVLCAQPNTASCAKKDKEGAAADACVGELRVASAGSAAVVGEAGESAGGSGDVDSGSRRSDGGEKEE